MVYFSIHRYEHGEFWPNLRESDYDYVGDGDGLGYNFNVPLNSTGLGDTDYMAIFQQVLLPMALEVGIIRIIDLLASNIWSISFSSTSSTPLKSVKSEVPKSNKSSPIEVLFPGLIKEQQSFTACGLAYTNRGACAPEF